MNRNVAAALSMSAVALMVAAGCSASGGGQPAGAPATGAVVVTTRQAGNAGTVLVDAGGHTLYFADQERDGSIRCTGPCIQIWRPLAVTGGGPSAGPGVAGTLSTVRRPDGVTQVTLDGKPLYTFAYDERPGAVEGDNVTDDFAGNQFRWHAATVGAPVSPAAPSSGGYGNGY